jgi:hypothetical protein
MTPPIHGRAGRVVLRYGLRPPLRTTRPHHPIPSAYLYPPNSHTRWTEKRGPVNPGEPQVVEIHNTIIG